jgi:bifunctional DNase/RNase
MPRLLVLPSIAVAAVLAVAGSAAGRGAPDGRVELEVAGVLPVPGEPVSILVLREKGTKTLLPLFVSASAGSDAGDDKHPSGLAGEAISALGGRVAEVQIDRAEEEPAAARVRLSQGGRRLEVRARPSESVALALAAGAPILTTRRVLDQSGLTEEDLVRAHRRAAHRVRRL